MKVYELSVFSASRFVEYEVTQKHLYVPIFNEGCSIRRDATFFVSVKVLIARKKRELLWAEYLETPSSPLKVVP